MAPFCNLFMERPSYIHTDMLTKRFIYIERLWFCTILIDIAKLLYWNAICTYKVTKFCVRWYCNATNRMWNFVITDVWLTGWWTVWYNYYMWLCNIQKNKSSGAVSKSSAAEILERMKQRRMQETETSKCLLCPLTKYLGQLA